MEVIILAVTYMQNGFCFAGMTKDGRWVRPVLPSRNQWTSLYYENGEPICIGDVIKVNGRNRPDPPHTEDIEVKGFNKVDKLTHKQLISLLEKHSESLTSLHDTLDRNGRSLCLIKVSSFRIVHIKDNDIRRTRLAFTLVDHAQEYINTTLTPGYPCSCLHWRGIQLHRLTLPMSANNKFMCIGLARGFYGDRGQWVDPAPMVISVITDPPLPGGINYDNP